MKNSLMLTALSAVLAFGTLAQGAEPKVKVLSVVEDATQKTVLIGRNFTDSMIVIFELKPAKAMWMKPVTTKFHFKLAGSKVTEVSEPVDETQK